MARKVILFVVAYILYIPLVFGLLGLGVFVADKYVDTSENPVPGWVMLLLLIAVIGGPVLVYCIVWNRAPGWARELQRTGTRAPAFIRDVADTGVSTNGGLTIYVKLTLEVRPEGAPSFVATIETGNSRVGIMRPGGMLMVKYDPANLKHVVIDEEQDTGDTADGRSAASMDAVAEMLANLRPGAPARLRGTGYGFPGDSGGVDAAAADGLAGQLEKLDELHRGGALTDAEYAAAKAKLLA